MIYFHFSRETILDFSTSKLKDSKNTITDSDPDSYILNKYAHILSQIESNAPSSDSPQKLIELKLKLIYDMADYIHDKRFETKNTDSELQLMAYCSTTKNIHSEDFVSEIFSNYQDPTNADRFTLSQSKLQTAALRILWNYITDFEATSRFIDNSTLSTRILCYLVKGNICLRISECHMADFDYLSADEWGKRAIDIFWSAKQISSTNEAREQLTDMDTYHYLIKLNLAKYLRDYAKRNRKSDFKAAQDEYQNILNKIESINKDEFTNCAKTVSYSINSRELTSSIKRCYSLIWLDAISDISYIDSLISHDLVRGTELKLLYFLKLCFDTYSFSNNTKNILSEYTLYEEISALIPRFITITEGDDETNALEREILANNIWPPNFRDKIKNYGFGLKSEDSKIQAPYDIKRYILLNLNELSQIGCRSHSTTKYVISLKTANIADKWYQLLKLPSSTINFIPQKKKNMILHNSATINTISLACRKFFEYSNHDDDFYNILSSHLEKIFQDDFKENKPQDEKYITYMCWLFNRLRYNHKYGNLHSSMELIKWCCVYLEFKDPKFVTIYNKLLQIKSTQKTDTAEKILITDNSSLKSITLEKLFEIFDNKHNTNNSINIQKTEESTTTDNAKQLIQLLFLKGFYLFSKYSFLEAIECFDEVISRSESDYIRRGSLGLKARYIKAKCLMSVGQYKEAENILEYLKKALVFSDESHNPDYTKKGKTTDEKIELNLGYCYMKRGNYTKALDIYKLLFGGSELSPEEILKQKKASEPTTISFAKTNIRPGDVAMQKKESSINTSTDYVSWHDTTHLKIHSQIMGLNNYAACHILSMRHSFESKDKTEKVIPNSSNSQVDIDDNLDHAKSAFWIFKTQEKYFKNQIEDDQYTNLLKGYYALCTGNDPADVSFVPPDKSIELGRLNQLYDFKHKMRLEIALRYFKKASDADKGFSLQNDLTITKEKSFFRQTSVDAGLLHDIVEKFSAYLICLIELTYCEVGLHNEDMYISNRVSVNDKKSAISISEYSHKIQAVSSNDTVKQIERILLSHPASHELSLKAAITLAEWLYHYQSVLDIGVILLEKEKSPYNNNLPDHLKEIQQIVDERRQLIRQLYRSFSFISIYKERGTRVFNELKHNKNFRFFDPVERGEILGYLLMLYRPIKTLKEECCFNLDDLYSGPNKSLRRELVHHTKIDILKILLTDSKEAPARFRLNNCGYMNDIFEGNSFLIKIRQIANSINKNNDSSSNIDTNRLLLNYYPQLGRIPENMLPSSNDVYIGCVSVKKDSFPMWNIYGDKEKGCNIEFGENFFDIAGAPYQPYCLRNYLMSKYTDDDYPLYIVQYIKDNISEDINGDIINSNPLLCNSEEFQSYQSAHRYHAILPVTPREQKSDTEGIDLCCLNDIFTQIYLNWEMLESYLSRRESKEFDNTPLSQAISYIRSFTANRLDEIRFLFKDEDYAYEGEVRVVYTASSNSDSKTKPKIDASQPGISPRLFVELNRDIEDLTIRLGSLIDDVTVDQYVTWLMGTKKVKKVILARRNRYTIDNN